MNHKTNGYLFGRIDEAAVDTSHPRHRVAQDLSTKFRSLELHFFDKIHPFVDVGLAVDQTHQGYQDGGPPNIMTVHGCRHVSDLIDSLDKIATHIAEAFPDDALDLEEAYILLCSAHVHDAGNIGGRMDHANRSGALIETHKHLFSGTARRERVFDVSRVHGGNDQAFGQDTLRSLNADNYQRPRLPLLAAILRMGDELSENPERAPEAVLAWFKTSGESVLAHRYSEAFRTFELKHDELFVTLRVYPAQDNCSATIDNGRLTFYEYLERRLNKMEMEVRYCSQYGRPYLSVRRIRVSIQYHENDAPSRYTRVGSLTLELERGYPQELPPLMERCEELRDYGTLGAYCRGASQ